MYEIFNEYTKNSKIYDVIRDEVPKIKTDNYITKEGLFLRFLWFDSYRKSKKN